MGEKRQPVDEADLTDEIVDTVKEVMGDYHQGKARQLAAMLLGVFKIKGWEVVEKPRREDEDTEFRHLLSKGDRARIQEMRPNDVRKKP